MRGRSRWAAALVVSAVGTLACATAPRVAYEERAPFAPHAAQARADALAAAERHPDHDWRDRSPTTPEGHLRGMIEIGLGDRDKREFSIPDNALVVDRVIAAELGGYPTNYGFLPRTIAFDGDPLDILVLGPRLEPGTWVQGEVLGVLHMSDEKGEDPKIVLSPLDEDGSPRYELHREDKARIAGWFARYKRQDPSKRSQVSGWGDPEDARRILGVCEDFYTHGADRPE